MSLDVALLKSSFDLVVSREPKITSRFYDILFGRYPQARALFSRHSSVKQQRMLHEALVAVLEHLEDATWLSQTLGTLGERHRGYGVTDDMYAWVGESLLAALCEVAGDDWTPKLETAWSDAYRAIASMMQQQGSVSSHHRDASTGSMPRIMST